MKAMAQRWAGAVTCAGAMAGMLASQDLVVMNACSGDLPWWLYWGLSCWMPIVFQP